MTDDTFEIRVLTDVKVKITYVEKTNSNKTVTGQFNGFFPSDDNPLYIIIYKPNQRVTMISNDAILRLDFLDQHTTVKTKTEDDYIA